MTTQGTPPPIREKILLGGGFLKWIYSDWFSPGEARVSLDCTKSSRVLSRISLPRHETNAKLEVFALYWLIRGGKTMQDLFR